MPGARLPQAHAPSRLTSFDRFRGFDRFRAAGAQVLADEAMLSIMDAKEGSNRVFGFPPPPHPSY